MAESYVKVTIQDSIKTACLGVTRALWRIESLIDFASKAVMVLRDNGGDDSKLLDRLGVLLWLREDLGHDLDDLCGADRVAAIGALLRVRRRGAV